MEVSKEEIIETLQHICSELTEINDVAKTITKLSMAKAKVVRVEALEKELLELKPQIFKYNSKCKLPAEKIDYQKFAIGDLIDSVRATCFELEHKEKLKAQEMTSHSDRKETNGVGNRGTRMKLPKLNLPIFSGEIGEWPEFIDSFNRSIHFEETLSAGEKFQYLRGALRGDALKLISKFHLTTDNYPAAYALLIKTYQNKRLLANHFIRQLYEFRPISSDSVSNLKNFLTVFRGNVQALEALRLDDLPDFLLFYRALNCLDPKTKELFESKFVHVDFPSFDSLLEFVQDRVNINTLCSEPQVKSRPVRSPQVFLNRTEKRSSCLMCHKSFHNLYSCSEFKKLSPAERFKFARRHHYCFNCLSLQHFGHDCKSKELCSSCSRRHHSLLHLGDNNGPPKPEAQPEPCEDHVKPSVLHSTSKLMVNPSQTVLLSTAKVRVLDCRIPSRPVRVLIDTGSQTNLITKNCLKRLGMAYHPCTSSIRGIAAVSHPVRGRCKLSVSSLSSPEFEFTLDALVVDHITDISPLHPIQVTDTRFLDDLTLADESFDKPGEVEGIFGASVFAQIVGSKVRKAEHSSLCAVETALGYIVMGTLSAAGVDDSPFSLCLFSDPPLEEMVHRFFELEEGESTSSSIQEDEICESLFQSSLVRTNTGQYSVDLPFKEDPSVLGDSFRYARTRLLSLERKLKSSPTLRLNYNKLMQLYLDLGYMSKVNEPDRAPGYFIPHHGILRPTSNSTPLRVVFDGSAKTTSAKSLNDILYSGPKLQSDLFSVLLNFRLFSVAMTADIKQMYLRIGVNAHHRKFQRLLWRFNTKDPIETFELNTVTFGLTSSPYLALRVVKQLVEDEKNNFPNACQIIPSDMYVDDLTTSCKGLEEGKRLFTELTSLFRAGNFDLLKWATNSQELLDFIPPDRRAAENVTFDSEGCLKVLGLKWLPGPDCFAFSVEELVANTKCTKRAILSVLARIYDPMGFLSCVTVYVKLLLKNLWASKIDWDDTLPVDLVNSWKSFLGELPLLSRFRLPRYLQLEPELEIDLVGFCDASLQAYGAVVYLRTGRGSMLVASKSKVAPLKPLLTIPRLELCSSVILAKLLRKILDAVSGKLGITNVWAFCDSQVALAWIRSSPTRWQPFVANRVSQVQKIIPQARWLHVSTKENPADCISRSIQPSKLLEHPLWFQGPKWLSDDPKVWPSAPAPEFLDHEALVEQKPKLVLVASTNEESPILELALRFSSWSKYRRSVVYLLRFIRTIKFSSALITAAELDVADNVIFRALQSKYFKADVQLIKNKEPCSPKIRHLSPFLHEGLIRVGGRLAHAGLVFDATHPILLPSKDHVVDLLIDHYHHKNLHTGPSLLLSILRQRFWILAGRAQVKRRVRLCNFCFRFTPKPTFPMMGNLPSERVRTSKPFEYVGVDYMGPFQISLGRFRGCKTHKAWVSVFVCLATKALHLELATELSTAAFLAAFKRFLSRRGQCRKLYSDQGTNFLGAKSQLEELYTFLSSAAHKSAFTRELAEHKIDWHFNPPSAPHFGGLWESQVKVIKRHLLKVIGLQILTFEEFSTVLAQIEALLNSRPLSLLSDDPNEPSAVTPAHFLNSAPLTFLPSADVTDINPNRLARPQMLDALVQHWWLRWSREYLHTLQTRQKWLTPAMPIRCGLVVLIIEANLPPFKWPLGIVEKIFPGPDGTVRVAEVRTSKGSYRRPVVKLCPLPSQ